MLMASVSGFKRATTSIDNEQREASNKSGSVIVKCKNSRSTSVEREFNLIWLSLNFDHGETDFFAALSACIFQPRNVDLAIGAGNTVTPNAQGAGARSVLSSRHLRGESFGGRVMINHFDTA
jgi:hypothetical protein